MNIDWTIYYYYVYCLTLNTNDKKSTILKLRNKREPADILVWCHNVGGHLPHISRKKSAWCPWSPLYELLSLLATLTSGHHELIVQRWLALSRLPICSWKISFALVASGNISSTVYSMSNGPYSLLKLNIKSLSSFSTWPSNWVMGEPEEALCWRPWSTLYLFSYLFTLKMTKT